MKTGCILTYKGPGAVRISLGAPRFRKGPLPAYRALMPERAWLKLDKPAYCRRFFGMLSRLDPQKVWDELHELVAPEEPVLLCFEKLDDSKPGEWCHRRMVAAWLRKNLGVELEEVSNLELVGDNPCDGCDEESEPEEKSETKAGPEQPFLFPAD